jgi:hypothetical protein
LRRSKLVFIDFSQIPFFEVFGYMPLLREALNLQVPMTFLMGGVFLTIFNKIRDVYKIVSLLGKHTQYLKSCFSETAGRTKFA